MPEDTELSRLTVSREARPEHEPPIAMGNLRRELSSFEVILLTLSIGSPLFNIYIVGGDVLQHVGTATVAAFLTGLAATVVWMLVYAELGSACPCAGGDYVAVGSLLAPWAGFAILAMGVVTTAPGLALEAKFVAHYVEGLTSLSTPSTTAIATVLTAMAIAMLATRTGAIVTGVCLLIEMLTVILLTAKGAEHPVRSWTSVIMHSLPPNGAGGLSAVPNATFALGCVTAIYATVGGNQALYFGEELKQPHRNMGRVVVLCGLIGSVSIAVPVIAVVLSADNLVAMLHSSDPFASFIASSFGTTVSRAVSACVALAIFNALIAGIMASARLLLSIGRDVIFPAYINQFLVRLHHKSGTPRVAAFVVSLLTGAWCFAPTHFLVVLIQAQITYGFAFVCIAVLVGRIKGKAGKTGYWRSPGFPLIPLLGLCLSIAFWVVDFLDATDGRPSIIIMSAVVSSAILWYGFVLRRRPGGWRPRLGP